MTQNPAQIGSPEWVTEKIENGLERLSRFLEAIPGSTLLIYLIFFAAAIATILNIDFIESNARDPKSGDLLALVRFGVILLPLFFIPRLFLKTWLREPYEQIVTAAFFLIAFASYVAIWWPTIIFLNMGLLILTYCLPIFLLFITRGLGFWLRFSILLISVIGVSHIAENFMTIHNWFVTRANMVAPISLLMMEEAAGVNITKATLTRLLFSPFMLFNPLPVEQKDRAIAEGSKRLFILGAIDFTKAIAVMFIAWQMLDPQFQFDNSDFFSTLLHGYWKFIFLVLIRFAWSFLFVGAGRWMGFNMSDPIRVPLLATNFFDYKKRSQSYMFNWSMTLFYAPIFGKTGSTFLAAFLAFTIQGIILSWSRFPSSLGVYVTWTLIPVAVASALIAFAAATPSLWPSGRKWSGWFGVLIVNAVLGLITGAQFYLPH